MYSRLGAFFCRWLATLSLMALPLLSSCKSANHRVAAVKDAEDPAPDVPNLIQEDNSEANGRAGSCGTGSGLSLTCTANTKKQWIYTCRRLRDQFSPDRDPTYHNSWIYLGKIKEEDIPKNSYICIGWSNMNNTCSNGVVTADRSQRVACTDDLENQLAYTRD